jgi:predicted glycogen debranching enzyme
MIEIGRNVCSDQRACTDTEWLVTNGIGGYASGTISGVLTRRYHGLLVAALQPPAGRTVLVTKVDETVTYDGDRYELFANQWGDGAGGTAPEGNVFLNSFHLEGTAPVWTYSFADALLEKSIWMEHGQNSTYVRYTLSRGSSPVALNLKTLVNYKDFHANTHANGWQMNIHRIDHGVRVDAFDGASPFFLLSRDTALEPRHAWYQNYFLRVEQYRGLDTNGDHLFAGEATVTLEQGQSVTLVLSTEESALDGVESAWARFREREAGLVANAGIPDQPGWVQHLVLAADQFIVRRRAGDNPDGRSVIAGYHWFGDWGRDTMVSLPGLALATGRSDEAAMILRTFANYVDRGMLPNRFPDAGEQPEYNTVDATLWYFEGIRQYFQTTGDRGLVSEIYPVLKGIVASHEQGTRYSIHVDAADGLLYSGEDGVQLTWMDAKIGDWVVTPRTGKAIEINALWYNALLTMQGFAEALGLEGEASDFLAKSAQVQSAFDRFWNEALGYCYDVIDSPAGNDPAMRPNQLFAVSLSNSPFSSDRQRMIVDQCAHHLYTPHGLRSLAAFDPAYRPRYAGDQVQRDSSYHQGTVWAWLIGAFVEAHLRVYRDPQLARSFLLPFQYHLVQQGVGTIAEIFDADAPHLPRGCLAQAWSVAEVLRAWKLTVA